MIVEVDEVEAVCVHCCMYTLTCISRKKHIQKTTQTVLYYSIYSYYIIHSFSKKVCGENLMLKTLCGMVTQTIADSDRFSINFTFCKQRRVNFAGFFFTVSVCLSLLSKEKRKRNSKSRMHTISFCLY